MSKVYIIGFMIAFVTGWFGMGAYKDHPRQEQEKSHSANRISLLGTHSISSNLTPPEQFDDIKGLLERLHSASRAELKRWLTQSPSLSDDLAQIIVSKLSAIDPEETMSFLRSDSSLESYVGTALTCWAESDPKEAVDAALSLHPQGHHVIQMMIRSSPSQKLRIVQQLEETAFMESNPYMFGQILGFMPETHLEDTADKLLTASANNAGPNMALQGVMGSWGTKDQGAALAWASQLEDPARQQEVLGAIADWAVHHHGEEGLNQVWPLLDNEQREGVVAAFRPHTVNDMGKFVAWLDENLDSPTLYADMITKLAGYLSQSGTPEDIVDLLAHVEVDFVKSRLGYQLEHIALAWAERDAEGLQVWMDSLEDPDIRRTVHKGLITYWAREDPQRVLETWEQDESLIPSSNNRTSTLLYSLMANPSEVTALLERIPESLRDQAIELYARRLAYEDPAEAMAFVETLPAGDAKDDALQSTLKLWSASDPLQASQWIDAIENDEKRMSASKDLVDTWALTDPESARSWIMNQPPSPSRDNHLETLISARIGFDPGEAFSAALAIQDSERRDRLAESAFNDLSKRNPALAEERLQSNDFPENLQEKARQILGTQTTDLPLPAAF